MLSRAGFLSTVVGLGVVGVASVGARGAVTFHQPVRTVSVLTQADGALETATSNTLAPLDTTVQHNAPAIVNGQAVNTGGIAAISCTIDPTGVRGRTRLQGEGFVTANSVATTLIDVLVTVDAWQPFRIHSSASIFTANGASSLAVSVTSEANGQVVYSTASGVTGVDRLDVRGVLAPGTYRYVYNAALVAEDGSSDRDFSLRFELPCPADVDDGSGTGHTDGAVTIDDLLYYLPLFENGDPDADIDDGSGQGVPDEAVTIDDLLFFLARFEAGC